MKGREIVQHAPQLYIDLDVEADGVAGYGSLLSIGAVSPWGETFYRELYPHDEEYIDGNRQFCEEHNLERQRLLREGIPANTAVGELADWSLWLKGKYQKQGKVVMAAFNASFDFPLVGREFERAGIDNPFGVAGFCIKSLAMVLAPGYDWSKTAKSRLPSDIVPPGDFTHHALEDAIYQQKLHFALAGKIADIAK